MTRDLHWTNRSLRLPLGAGAAIGLALAVAGALAPAESSRLSRGAVAKVNGQEITRASYTLAAERIAAGRSNALTKRDRRWILDRLIDEELLVQRGVDSGLLESDMTVRKAVANAVIDFVFADASRKTPGEEQLHTFYETYKARFFEPARIHVQDLYFAGTDDAANRARQAYDAIAGGTPFATAQQRYVDPNGAPIPDAMIPLHELRGLLGPTLTVVAVTMKPGETSRPIKSPSGYHILYVKEFEPEKILSYEAARPQVEEEFRRRAPDDTLQSPLDRLRKDACIALAPGAPRQD